MESQSSMFAFVTVVEAQSFTAAARELRVPKSTLSKRIARLESRLGAQLLTRTTRRVSVTDIGAAYYARCKRIVADIREAETMVRATQERPSGTLRVTCPSHEGGLYFGELAVAFLARYPDVELDVLMTNRFVDLISEGYDVAFRAGVLEDSTLIARKLGTVEVHLVASPEHLARHGVPSTVAELRSRPCLTQQAGEGRSLWRTRSGDVIPVRPRLRANDPATLKRAALAGLGLAFLPSVFVYPEVVTGELVRVLPDEMCTYHGMYVVYPPGRYLSAKVRAFVDFVVSYFEANPMPGMESSSAPVTAGSSAAPPSAPISAMLS